MGFEIFGKRDLGERDAVCKCGVVYHHKTFGELDLAQGDARAKRIVTDLGHTLGNGDALE